MLNRYSVIAIAFFSLGAQNASAGNEHAQRMIQPVVSASGTSLPAAFTHKEGGQGQAHSLWAPIFVNESEHFVGTSKIVGIDGHEQAGRMLVGQ